MNSNEIIKSIIKNTVKINGSYIIKIKTRGDGVMKIYDLEKPIMAEIKRIS